MIYAINYHVASFIIVECPHRKRKQKELESNKAQFGSLEQFVVRQKKNNNNNNG